MANTYDSLIFKKHENLISTILTIFLPTCDVFINNSSTVTGQGFSSQRFLGSFI